MNMRKIVIIAIGVLVIGAGLNIFFSIRDTLVEKSDEITLTESFENIEILVENATVEILPSDDSTTTVSFEGKMKSKSKYKFKADVKKNTLQVELTNKKWSTIGFNFNPFSVKVTVYVPEQEYKKIKADSDNGALVADRIQAEDINFKTNNGRIHVKQVENSNVYARTNNGRIVLEDVDGDIDAITNNGRIELYTDKLDHTINLSTDNGKVFIETKEKPTNATIKASTDNGKISVFGKSNEHTEFGKGHNQITIETDNGSITVK